MLNLLQSSVPTLESLLSPDLMARLRSLGRLSRYHDGELIFQRGDWRPHFTLVEKGQVIAGSEGVDGSYHTAALMSPGDHFGEHTLFAGLPRMQSMRAIGEVELMQIPSTSFMDVYDQEPALGRALLVTSLRRIHLMMEFIDLQGRAPLPVRVAHLLVTSVTDNESGLAHIIECRQEDLALILGVSRVAVSKSLKTLQEKGLIAMHYGSVELIDKAELLNWLKDTYQVVPVEPDKNWRF